MWNKVVAIILALGVMGGMGTVAFQLSAYTAQDGKFSEVLIDHNTGKVAKTEAITGSVMATPSRWSGF